MLFTTPTQYIALAVALIAGWLFGLASHPGGKKWKARYIAERDAHALTTNRSSELERENTRLAKAAPVVEDRVVRDERTVRDERVAPTREEQIVRDDRETPLRDQRTVRDEREVPPRDQGTVRDDSVAARSAAEPAHRTDRTDRNIL